MSTQTAIRLTPVQQATLDRLRAAHSGFLSAHRAYKALSKGGPIRPSSLAYSAQSRYASEALNYRAVLLEVGEAALKEWPHLAPLLAPLSL